MTRFLKLLLPVVALGLVALGVTAPALAADCNVPICKEQGGARWHVGSGGSLDIESGGEFDIEAGGTFAIAGTTVTASAAEFNAITGIAGATGLTLGNSETLNTNTDAVFDFTRNDAGVVTLTCSDDNAVAACTYDAGGASPIVVGSADVTVVTISTDDTGDGTDLVLPAQGVNGSEILNDTITATQTSNTLCLQVVSVEINPTEAGATNDFVNLVDNSASTTEANEDMFMVPVAAVVHNLRAEIDVAPGAGNDDWKVTLRDDAAGTTLTCNIDETATSCTDTSNAPSIAAGSNLAILVDSSGGGADPTAAAVLTIAFCLGQ